MADRPWKKFEREVAGWIGGKRFWANSGCDVDVEGLMFVGQCKEVQTLSLAELTRLVDVAVQQGQKRGGRYGLVGVKLRAGRGRPTTALAVMPGYQLKAVLDTIGVLQEEIRQLRYVVGEQLPAIKELEQPSVAGQGA